MTTYFPTGIVTGRAFCNRAEERDYLKRRLEQNAHVVLMSPRRYGKSSLIAQFTHDQDIPFATADLLPSTSGKYIKHVVIEGVSQLLDSIMPTSKKSTQKILSFFYKMNPTVELSAFGQKINLRPEEKTPEEAIMKLLMSLDKAAEEMGRKLIFVMDEFQQIAKLDNSHSLEASIRHAVERSRHVFYIFSGSNRTLLEDMFSNRQRPLYHLCDEMKLNRIEKTHYTPFIKKASKKNWGSALHNASIDKILELTECHPYYVNRLCRMLWDMKDIPDEKAVNTLWQQYVETQKTDWILDMIGQLTVNQRITLAALAKQPETSVLSNTFSSRIGLPTSSIQRTLTSLIKQDLAYQDNNGYYQVLNPVIKTLLAEKKYLD